MQTFPNGKTLLQNYQMDQKRWVVLHSPVNPSMVLPFISLFQGNYQRHGLEDIQQRFHDIMKFYTSLSHSVPKYKKTNIGDIPAHILKNTSDLAFNKITNIANSMVQSCIFPDPLKLADVSPVWKDGTNALSNNYRPINVYYLPSLKFLNAF